MNRPRFKSSGFTLLELVLVMLVLTIVMAMAAPSLTHFWRGSRLRDSAEQVVAVTRYARTQAISDGTVYRFNIDPQSRSYFLTMREGEQFVRTGTEFGREFTFPLETQIELSRIDGQTPDHIDFFPTGRSELATIRVSASGEQDILIGCATPTELYAVISDGGSR